MVYYDALVAKWATLTPGTTAVKLAQINAITVTGAAVPMIIPSYMIYNLLDPAEFTALTAANQALVRDLVNMGTVDGSPGKPARARMVAIYPSGTTRTALNALAATYDSPPIPWATATIAQGGGGLTGPVGTNDLIAAGNLT